MLGVGFLSPAYVSIAGSLVAGYFLLLAGGCSSASSGSPFAGGAVSDAAPAASDATSETPAPVADATSGTFAEPEGAAAPKGCKPGNYVGQYNGTFETIVPTSGPVAITLTTSTVSVGENELVTSGGTWDTKWATVGDGSLEEGHAMLVGQLDCSADTFTAMGENAYFTILGVDSGTFTLNLTGTYDPATETISGMFTYMSTDGNGGGMWQVTLTD
jgi:hypothetical protein